MSATGATSMSSGKKGPKADIPLPTLWSEMTICKPVKGPLVYKAAAQHDDLALVGIERQSILAPANQALDRPLKIGDSHGVQQGKVNEVKRLERNRGVAGILRLGKEECFAQAGIRDH